VITFETKAVGVGVSGVRLVVTIGIAWILSLTLAFVVLFGIHRVLSPSSVSVPRTSPGRLSASPNSDGDAGRRR